MRLKSFLAAGVAGAAMTLAVGLAPSAQAAEEVEVLHWWTSGGEAAALNVLKQDLEGQGVTWQDMPVAGGGGTEAMTVLRARVTAGNAPTAVQMLGFDIQDWAAEGALADLNAVAESEGWDGVVPAALQRFAKYDGKWISAPVNVHSTNWVWANKAIMDELGIAAPGTWDELVAALDAIQAAGYVALAHGGQAWQEATIFDGVLMSTGGTDFYQKAMIELDPEALGSDTMKMAFDRMATLRSYVDDNFSGRDWNLATAMVIEGKAGMQMMGDWAKGEFLNAGKQPGVDFVCFRHPGTQGTVDLQRRPVRHVRGGRRTALRAGEAGVRDHVDLVPVRLQRGQGLGARAHGCLRRGLRRLRQEGHEGPGRGQRQRHALRLVCPRTRVAGVGEERHLRRRHRPLQR